MRKIDVDLTGREDIVRNRLRRFVVAKLDKAYQPLVDFVVEEAGRRAVADIFKADELLVADNRAVAQGVVRLPVSRCDRGKPLVYAGNAGGEGEFEIVLDKLPRLGCRVQNIVIPAGKPALVKAYYQNELAVRIGNIAAGGSADNFLENIRHNKLDKLCRFVIVGLLVAVAACKEMTCIRDVKADNGEIFRDEVDAELGKLTRVNAVAAGKAREQLIFSVRVLRMAHTVQLLLVGQIVVQNIVDQLVLALRAVALRKIFPRHADDIFERGVIFARKIQNQQADHKRAEHDAQNNRQTQVVELPGNKFLRRDGYVFPFVERRCAGNYHTFRLFVEGNSVGNTVVLGVESACCAEYELTVTVHDENISVLRVGVLRDYLLENAVRDADYGGRLDVVGAERQRKEKVRAGALVGLLHDVGRVAYARKPAAPRVGGYVGIRVGVLEKAIGFGVVCLADTKVGCGKIHVDAVGNRAVGAQQPQSARSIDTVHSKGGTACVSACHKLGHGIVALNTRRQRRKVRHRLVEGRNYRFEHSHIAAIKPLLDFVFRSRIGVDCIHKRNNKNYQV